MKRILIFVLNSQRLASLTYLPLLLFLVLGTAVFWNTLGDDLASSYVGCRVLATGQGQQLYSYDPGNFAATADKDKAWPTLANEGDYHSYLHPYVQTPLWAWGLEPLCDHMQFPAFKHLCLILALASLAAIVALVAKFWTPHLFRPWHMLLILVALGISEPFLFAMNLVQTHALLLLLTVAGLILAERGRWVLAGLCVALAAAVKITPAILLIYWLCRRQWRAAGSLVAWSAMLLAITRLIVGPALFHDFLTNMHRVSNVLLVSESNQSLASTYMTHFFGPDEIFDLSPYPLPSAVRLVSMACMLACTVAGGLLDNARAHRKAHNADAHLNTAPFGAGIALVAMTIFAPIAWTHYSIVLVIPAMLLAAAAYQWRTRSMRWLLAISVIFIAALLFRPLAPDVVHMDLSDYAILHGTFFAGVLALLALFIAGVAALRIAPENA